MYPHLLKLSIQLPYIFPCNNCISLPICINEKDNISFCNCVDELLNSISTWSFSYKYLLIELRKLNAKSIIELHYYNTHKVGKYLFEFACILNDGQVFEYHEEYPYFDINIDDIDNELEKKLFKRNMNIFENLNEYKKTLGWLKKEDRIWEQDLKH